MDYYDRGFSSRENCGIAVDDPLCSLDRNDDYYISLRIIYLFDS